MWVCLGSQLPYTQWFWCEGRNFDSVYILTVLILSNYYIAFNHLLYIFVDARTLYDLDLYMC